MFNNNIDYQVWYSKAKQEWYSKAKQSKIEI